MKFTAIALAFAAAAFSTTATAAEQPCPDKNRSTTIRHSPPGGESDISARHQQLVLKKKCPGIGTVMQHTRPGAGGGLSVVANERPACSDGLNVVGINLPHIVLQPLEGQVQYKTEDITPTYWFHFTPDAIVVSSDSPIKTFADLIKMAKAQPGKLTLGGSGTNSTNHAAHEKLNQAVAGIQTTYVPYQGTAAI